MAAETSHKSWLLTCPCGDCNFKIHLKEASTEDIESVIEELQGKQGVKSKIATLQAELRRRKRDQKANLTITE